MGINLITERDVIRGVRDRWMKEYRDCRPNSLLADGISVGEIAAGLAELDLETCSREDVDRVMGNASWTRNECDNCEELNCPVLVHFGDEPDYEARWQDLCPKCLEEGVKLLKG